MGTRWSSAKGGHGGAVRREEREREGQGGGRGDLIASVCIVLFRLVRRAMGVGGQGGGGRGEDGRRVERQPI